jgi:hypothetical protein
MVERLVVVLTAAAAEARVDPAALAKMAVTAFLPLAPVKAAAAARVDQHPLLVQREHLPLAALAAQEGLQVLGVLEL